MKEIRHAVKVCIRAKFSPVFCPDEHAIDALPLYSCCLAYDPRYVRIPLAEFTDCVESHAAFCARQVISLGESGEGILNG